MTADDSSGQRNPCRNGGESRRTMMLSWLLGGGALASLASFLYPVIRFLNLQPYFFSVPGLLDVPWLYAKRLRRPISSDPPGG